MVVVSRFDDPTQAPRYSDGVGRAMSDAYSRTLDRRRGYEIRIDDQLAAEVRRFARFDLEKADADAAAEHDADAAVNTVSDHSAHHRGRVDYVIVGKVTDFYHTRDLADDASRWGIIGRRSEAIVGVDLRVVDVESMQVVGTDHVIGTANAGRTDSESLYQDIALDSYLFWNTPLGRAGRRAIDQAVTRSMAMMPAKPHTAIADSAPLPADESVAPATDDNKQRVNHATHHQHPESDPQQRGNSAARFGNARPQILRVDDARRVTIMGGRSIGVVHGDRFHIAREVSAGSADTLVNDAVTGRPLRIAITEVAETTSTGWLLGQKPRQLDLRGMLLHLPGAPLNRVKAQTDAASTGGP